MGTAGTASPQAVEEHTRRWLDRFVVGLELCPFARPLLGSDQLRIAICEEADADALDRAFLLELDRLQASSEEEIATTLLVFPCALEDFGDYLAFLDRAQALLEAGGLAGIVQLASFHPHYRFQGEAEDAASQYSNRAPYPVIHLLRESMLTRVLADYPDPERIPQKNIATLEQVGSAELERRWRVLFEP